MNDNQQVHLSEATHVVPSELSVLTGPQREKLRERAEIALSQIKDLSPESLELLTPKDTYDILQELRVHQFELEMQNEELRQTQIRLEVLRERYFDLYDLAPVGYCIVNEAGIILTANLTLSNLLNFSCGEIQQSPLSRYIYRDDQDIFYLHFKQLFKICEPVSCELRLLKSDGSHFWAQLSTSICSEHGVPCGWIVFNDISARKAEDEAREKLFREVSQLQNALDEHAVVAIADVHGRITYVNDKFCQLYKYSREELIGQDHRIVNSGIHPKEYMNRLWTTIAQGQVWNGEICNRAKDGKFHWVVMTIVPFKDDSGKVQQYVSIQVDINAVKSANRLATQESIQLSLTDMSATLAENIEGPLNTIVETADLLKETLDGPNTLKSKIEEIETAAYQINKIVKGLKHYSERSGENQLKALALPEIVKVVLAMNDAKAKFLDCEAQRRAEFVNPAPKVKKAISAILGGQP